MVLVCGLFVSTADASIGTGSSLFAPQLSFNGTRDIIRDDSVGVFSGNLSLPAVDDILQGIFKINDVDNTPSSASTWGIYSFQVTSINQDTGVISFGAATGTNSIEAILGDVGITAPAPDYAGSIANYGIAIISNPNSSISLPEFDNNFSQTLGNVVTDLTDAWRLEMLAGFVDSSDFHHVKLDDATSGRFRGAYSVMWDRWSNTNYRETTANVAGFDGNPYSGELVVDSNATITVPSNDTNPSGWDFSDKADFALNPVPEPSTIAIWAALGLGGCGVVARRRMKAKKA